ncbi:MAG TPA: hypothetical protein VL989_03200 [Candidatus Sulfotelmatobacter sp.]|nr:hypothetical protein [Candidatus Sulfotelmatobacter sp.]
MEQYISGEQHTKMSTKPTKKNNSKTIIWVIVAIVALGISFYGGTQYGKNHTNLASSRFASSGFGGPGRGHFQDRVIGTVEAITSNSITVTSRFNNSNTTLAITSSTQITDNGQSVSASDIKTGDTVFIIENTSNTSEASTILLNPSFGGGPISSGSNTSSGSQTSGSNVN